MLSRLLALGWALVFLFVSIIVGSDNSQDLFYTAGDFIRILSYGVIALILFSSLGGLFRREQRIPLYLNGQRRRRIRRLHRDISAC